MQPYENKFQFWGINNPGFGGFDPPSGGHSPFPMHKDHISHSRQKVDYFFDNFFNPFLLKEKEFDYDQQISLPHWP